MRAPAGCDRMGVIGRAEDFLLRYNSVRESKGGKLGAHRDTRGVAG